MKYFLFFLWLVTLGAVAFAGEPDKTLHQQCLYPSVYVWNSVSRGSGIIVRSRPNGGGQFINTAFTAAHVLGGRSEATIYVTKYENWSQRAGHDVYEATVVRSDPTTDAAVLKFTSPSKLPVSTPDFRWQSYIGDKILKVGTGQSLPPRVDYGCVSSPVEPVDTCQAACIRCSVFSVGGDSGGGLFYENKLVGVLHALQSGSNNISYFVPLRGYFSEGDLQ